MADSDPGAANYDADRAKLEAIEGVRFGHLEAGAQPFDVSVNDTYYGYIKHANERYRCVVKSAPERQLLNEVIAGAVGRALGLPIPEFFIAVSPVGGLASKVKMADGRHLFFASVLEKGKMSYVWSGGDHNAHLVTNALYKDGELGGVYVFDDHVANADRHMGNILIGPTGKVWLIDHGHSLTGPTWAADELQADRKYSGKLQLWCTPSMGALEKSAVKAHVPVYSDAAVRVDIGAFLLELKQSGFVDDDELKSLRSFLVDRVPHLPGLVASALGEVGSAA